MNWCCGPLLKQMCSHLLHSHSMIWRHPRWHMIQWLIMRSHSQIFAGNLLTSFSQASTIKGQHILLKCRDLHVEVLNLNYSESVLLLLQICTSANLYIDTSSSLHFWFSQLFYGRINFTAKRSVQKCAFPGLTQKHDFWVQKRSCFYTKTQTQECEVQIC